MKMKLFKGNLKQEDFYAKILKDFFPETQDGFDRLSDAMNARINSQFCIQFKYNHQIENLTIVLSYIGYTTRLYCCVFTHENMRKSFIQTMNVLTAFACGLGFNVN